MPKLLIYAVIIFLIGALFGVVVTYYYTNRVFDEMQRVIRDQDKRIEILSKDLELCIEAKRFEDSDILGIDEEGDY